MYTGKPQLKNKRSGWMMNSNASGRPHHGRHHRHGGGRFRGGFVPVPIYYGYPYAMPYGEMVVLDTMMPPVTAVRDSGKKEEKKEEKSSAKEAKINPLYAVLFISTVAGSLVFSTKENKLKNAGFTAIGSLIGIFIIDKVVKK